MQPSPKHVGELLPQRGRPGGREAVGRSLRSATGMLLRLPRRRGAGGRDGTLRSGESPGRAAPLRSPPLPAARAGAGPRPPPDPPRRRRFRTVAPSSPAPLPVLQPHQPQRDHMGHVQLGGPHAGGDAAEHAALLPDAQLLQLHGTWRRAARAPLCRLPRAPAGAARSQQRRAARSRRSPTGAGPSFTYGGRAGPRRRLARPLPAPAPRQARDPARAVLAGARFVREVKGRGESGAGRGAAIGRRAGRGRVCAGVAEVGAGTAGRGSPGGLGGAERARAVPTALGDDWRPAPLPAAPPARPFRRLLLTPAAAAGGVC